MNKVSLVGRLTKDPEVRYSQGDNSIAIARFTVAVDRKGVKKDADVTADFVSCIAFRGTAEFLEKYFYKGMRIGLTGRIQTGSYTNKEGNKVYTTDVVAEEVEFVDSKGSKSETTTTDEGGFESVPEGVDAELPF